MSSDDAAEDARKCCRLLMESEGRKTAAARAAGEERGFALPPLFEKNRWRLARALHFAGAPDAEVHYCLHLMETTGGGEWPAKAAELRENLNYYRGESFGATPLRSGGSFEPSLLRASLQSSYVEYYNFGANYLSILIYNFLLYLVSPLISSSMLPLDA